MTFDEVKGGAQPVGLVAGEGENGLIKGRGYHSAAT